MEIFLKDGWKTLREKEKMLVTIIFSFSAMFSKASFPVGIVLERVKGNDEHLDISVELRETTLSN